MIRRILDYLVLLFIAVILGGLVGLVVAKGLMLVAGRI